MIQIIIGDSHTSALKKAISSEIFVPEIETHIIPTRQVKYESLLANERPLEINKQLKEDISSLIQKKPKPHIFVFLSGNNHASMSICPSPDPTQHFDFILPKYKYLGNIPDVAIVPYNQIKEFFKRRMLKNNIKPLIALRKEFPNIPMYSIISPPTIPSAEHIQKYMGRFKDRIENYGISPASFRLKFWLLQVEVLQEICQKHNIQFIPNPDNTQDNEGFLLEKFWSNDPTHANALYGKLVLEQIKSITGEV